MRNFDEVTIIGIVVFIFIIAMVVLLVSPLFSGNIVRQYNETEQHVLTLAQKSFVTRFGKPYVVENISIFKVEGNVTTYRVIVDTSEKHYGIFVKQQGDTFTVSKAMSTW